jgi:hypothetical protein
MWTRRRLRILLSISVVSKDTLPSACRIPDHVPSVGDGQDEDEHPCEEDDRSGENLKSRRGPMTATHTRTARSLLPLIRAS